MQISLENSNTVVCIISVEELADYGLTPNNLSMDNEGVQSLVKTILQKAGEKFGTDMSTNNLVIEMKPQDELTFKLTFTRINSPADLARCLNKTKLNLNNLNENSDKTGEIVPNIKIELFDGNNKQAIPINPGDLSNLDPNLIGESINAILETLANIFNETFKLPYDDDEDDDDDDYDDDFDDEDDEEDTDSESISALKRPSKIEFIPPTAARDNSISKENLEAAFNVANAATNEQANALLDDTRDYKMIVTVRYAVLSDLIEKAEKLKNSEVINYRSNLYKDENEKLYVLDVYCPTVQLNQNANFSRFLKSARSVKYSYKDRLANFNKNNYNLMIEDNALEVLSKL